MNMLFTDSIEVINITTVTVGEGKVIGFQCNATNNCSGDELHICINSSTPYGKHEDKRKEDLREFLDASEFQHSLSMVANTEQYIRNEEDGCIRTFVNFRILTKNDFEEKVYNHSEQKDAAFVVLIPSGSIVYCVFGNPHDCFNGNVLASLAIRYTSVSAGKQTQNKYLCK